MLAARLVEKAKGTSNLEEMKPCLYGMKVGVNYHIMSAEPDPLWYRQRIVNVWRSTARLLLKKFAECCIINLAANWGLLTTNKERGIFQWFQRQ